MEANSFFKDTKSLMDQIMGNKVKQSIKDEKIRIQGVDAFIESTKNILKRMAGIDIEVLGVPYKDDDEIISLGVTSIINFSGKIKGRFIIDMPQELALGIAKNIMLYPYTDVKDKMVIASISELNNIIAGNANTFLNNEFSLGLRLAPPIVLSGKNIVIAASEVESDAAKFTTNFGEFKVNIAFQGGDN